MIVRKKGIRVTGRRAQERLRLESRNSFFESKSVQMVSNIIYMFCKILGHIYIRWVSTSIVLIKSKRGERK